MVCVLSGSPASIHRSAEETFYKNFDFFPSDRRAGWWEEHLDLSQNSGRWDFESSHVNSTAQVLDDSKQDANHPADTEVGGCK